MSGWRTSMCAGRVGDTGGRCGGSALRAAGRQCRARTAAGEARPCARATQAACARRWPRDPADLDLAIPVARRAHRGGARSSAIRASSARRRRRSRRGGRPTDAAGRAAAARDDQAEPARFRRLRSTDLDRLLAAQPADGQALLTRATVLDVQGRYAEARARLRANCGRVAPIVVRRRATRCRRAFPAPRLAPTRA